MIPMFIGSGRRRLFSVFHPSGQASGRAALVCYPWGHEYIFAHRSLAQLALVLSRAGKDVLRFDYYGTGDSSGELEDADVDGWLADIDTAAEELMEVSGAKRLTLIGLRFGGALAAKFADLRGRKVDSIVLWDPTVSGSEYCSWLMHTEIQPMPRGLRKTPDAGALPEVFGFPLSPRMEQGMRGIDVREIVPRLSQRLLVLVTQPDASHDLLRNALASRTAPTDFEFVVDHIAWNEDWPHDAGTLPVRALARIASWME